MKPFIKWDESKHATKGMAGDTLFFTITEVSGKTNNKTYDLHANIIGKHVAYYRTEKDAKASAEAAVEHFLKRLGFWKCIVERQIEDKEGVKCE